MLLNRGIWLGNRFVHSLSEISWNRRFLVGSIDIWKPWWRKGCRVWLRVCKWSPKQGTLSILNIEWWVIGQSYKKYKLMMNFMRLNDTHYWTSTSSYCFPVFPTFFNFFCLYLRHRHLIKTPKRIIIMSEAAIKITNLLLVSFII